MSLFHERDPLNRERLVSRCVSELSKTITVRSLSLGSGISASMNDVTAIEHPTLKVPYEILNKRFRSAQKIIDREVSHVQTSVAELETEVNRADQSSVTVGSITDLLSGVIEKLTVLKRKANESIGDELESAHSCKKRLEHIKDYCTRSPTKSATDSVNISNWKKQRLDRMLVEHFLRCGYYDSAVKLAVQSKIENMTNIDLFLVSRQVEESLRRKETAKCLSWCYDNKTKLRKLHSTLEFNLRQQEFIELIRANKRMEGVKHVRKHLSSMDPNELQQQELQHVMGLLAFAADTQVEPYKSLFDECRWETLISQFREEHFKLFQLSSTSVFSVTLQSGLSALKTPQCYRKDGVKEADCPVCSDLMNELALPLPCAHCSQSRLVCQISGQPLNEYNPPLMLPNGYVYGFNSLHQMALQNKGKVICPRTKRVYDISDAEKVYVM